MWVLTRMLAHFSCWLSELFLGSRVRAIVSSIASLTRMDAALRMKEANRFMWMLFLMQWSFLQKGGLVKTGEDVPHPFVTMCSIKLHMVTCANNAIFMCYCTSYTPTKLQTLLHANCHQTGQCIRTLSLNAYGPVLTLVLCDFVHLCLTSFCLSC